VHKTAAGYAQCLVKDAYNPKMGVINLTDILFSEQVLLGNTCLGLFIAHLLMIG
jgi:hypothetical protein